MPEEQHTSQDGIQRRQFLAGATSGVALAAVAAGTELSAAQPQRSSGTASFREHLLQCLGGPWPEPCDLKAVLRETIQKDGYRVEAVNYEAEPGDRIPALLLIPDGIDANNPAPAVAVWHQHNGQWHLGKTEGPIEEVREGMKTIARGYQEAGAPERFSYWIEKGAGHVLSKEMYRRTREWFQQHLRDA